MKTEKPIATRRSVIFGICLAVGAFSGVFIIPIIFPPVGQIVHGTPVAYHSHVNVEYILDGKNSVMPGQIGIKDGIWPSNYLEGEGPEGQAPLHTHLPDNIIHIEPLENKIYSAADFLKVWGKDPGDYKVCLVIMNTCDSSVDPSELTLHDGDTLRIESN